MGRLSRLLKGFLSLFVSGLEERNPEALMEAARQEFRDKMAQYNLAFAPQQFYFDQTFNLLAMLVVGGLANVSGAVTPFRWLASDPSSSPRRPADRGIRRRYPIGEGICILSGTRMQAAGAGAGGGGCPKRRVSLSQI